MEYFVTLLIGFVFWRLLAAGQKTGSTRLGLGVQQPVAHQERRGGPIPVNPAKQAACKTARDAWLAEHDAVSVGATKRGDVYLCHGETSEKAL